MKFLNYIKKNKNTFATSIILMIIALSCSKRGILKKGHYSEFSTPHRSPASFNPSLLEKINQFKNLSDPKQIYLTCFNKGKQNIEKCYQKNLSNHFGDFESQISDLSKTDRQNFKDNFSFSLIEAEIKYINQKIVVSLSDKINQSINKEFKTCANLKANSEFKNCYFNNSLLNGANLVYEYQKKNPQLNPIEHVYLVKFIQQLIQAEKKDLYDKKIDFTLGLLEEELLKTKRKIVKKISKHIDPEKQSQISDLISLCHQQTEIGIQEFLQRNLEINIVGEKKLARKYNRSICLQLYSEKSITKKLGNIFNENYKKLLSIYQLTIEKNYLVKSNCPEWKSNRKKIKSCMLQNWDGLRNSSLEEILEREKIDITKDYSEFLKESIQKKQKEIFKSVTQRI